MIYLYSLLSISVPLLISFPLFLVDEPSFLGETMEYWAEKCWFVVYVLYTSSYYLFFSVALCLAVKVALTARKYARNDQQDAQVQTQLNKAVVFQVHSHVKHRFLHVSKYGTIPL